MSDTWLGFFTFRTKVFEDIDRMIHPELVIDRDIYNMDMMIAKRGPNNVPDNSMLSNRDEFRWYIGVIDKEYSKLPLLRPLNIETVCLLRPPIIGLKQLISLYLVLPIKTNSLLRPLCVGSRLVLFRVNFTVYVHWIS